jgi:hypothetical protein
MRPVLETHSSRGGDVFASRSSQVATGAGLVAMLLACPTLAGAIPLRLSSGFGPAGVTGEGAAAFEHGQSAFFDVLCHGTNRTEWVLRAGYARFDASAGTGLDLQFMNGGQTYVPVTAFGSSRWDSVARSGRDSCAPTWNRSQAWLRVGSLQRSRHT